MDQDSTKGGEAGAVSAKKARYWRCATHVPFDHNPAKTIHQKCRHCFDSKSSTKPLPIVYCHQHGCYHSSKNRSAECKQMESRRQNGSLMKPRGEAQQETAAVLADEYKEVIDKATMSQCGTCGTMVRASILVKLDCGVHAQHICPSCVKEMTEGDGMKTRRRSSSTTTTSATSTRKSRRIIGRGGAGGGEGPPPETKRTTADVTKGSDDDDYAAAGKRLSAEQEKAQNEHSGGGESTVLISIGNIGGGTGCYSHSRSKLCSSTMCNGNHMKLKEPLPIGSWLLCFHGSAKKGGIGDVSISSKRPAFPPLVVTHSPLYHGHSFTPPDAPDFLCEALDLR